MVTYSRETRLSLQTPITFKEGSCKVPDNYAAAIVRFDALGRRLAKNTDTFDKYKEGIKAVVDTCYADGVSGRY